MTFYYCYAPPTEGAAESLAGIREPTQRPVGHHPSPAATHDRINLLHDVKAIG